jgi:hypothetical protein
MLPIESILVCAKLALGSSRVAPEFHIPPIKKQIRVNDLPNLGDP